jgi:hypothetical protein
MINLSFLFILFILYFIVAPFFVFCLISKIYPKSEIINLHALISVIVGPLFFTLINYYCLLIPFSNNNHAFYLFLFVLVLITIYSIICAMYGNYINSLKLYKKEIVILYGTLLLLIPLFLIRPISGHDFIEYCLFGKMLAERGTIDWSNYWYNAQTGFYYVGLHGFSFPLFGSIEFWWCNKLLQVEPKFLLLKSISVYYGVMIIANGYIIFSYLKKNLFWHFLVFLFTSFYFFTFFTNFHIDTFRTSLLLLTITFLFLIFENKVKFDLNIFAFISGMAAFTHSLNAIVLFITCIFPLIHFKPNASKIIIYFAIMVFSGYIHYILDILLGAGWIFRDIKFY